MVNLNHTKGNQMLRMDLVPQKDDHQVFEIEDRGHDCFVKIEAGDYLIVVAGSFFGSAGAKFSHSNIVAKQNRLHDFKHYRKSGSKFWTSRAGIDFYFVIPKSKIYLLNEAGYSYVKVQINGEKWSFNVSGGTGDGCWTDWVRRETHVGCGCTQKSLRLLAEVALSPEECKARGITLDMRDMTDREASGFVERATESLIRNKLNVGHKIVLSDCTIHDGKGPFEIESRGKNYTGRQLGKWIVISGGYRCRVSPKNIDWTETAKASDLEVAEPYSINYIGNEQACLL